MKHGQVLVLVVLALGALLAVVGLALDSSRIYQTRRVLQNAADAAALAGAVELASNPNTTQGQIWQKVASYLQANGADPTSARAWLMRRDTVLVEISQSNSTAPPPPSANRVAVLAVRTIPILFAGFLGHRESKVQARAVASVGSLRLVGPRNNVVPMAVHYEVVREAQEGDTLILWDGYQVTVQPQNDSARNYGETGNPYSGWLNLAWIHNSTDESREIDPSHSQANVKDWIWNGNPYPIIAGTLSIPPNPPATDGDFLMGDPGIRASGLQQLEVKRQQLIAQGQRPIFFFLVFDRFFDRSGMSQLFPNHGNFPNSTYFHAVGFVAVEVTEVQWQGSARGGKYVKGKFVRWVQTGSLNEASGSLGGTLAVKAVTLTE